MAVKQREGSPALPSYVWDPRLQGGRYVEAGTGRMVKRSKVVDLLREVSDSAGDTMANVAQLYVDGTVSSAVFEEAMSMIVRRAWTANSALAAGGWDQLSQADRNRLSQGLRTELQRVTDFAGELDELSDAQVVARARSYDSKAYSRFYSLERQRHIASGEYTQIRWESVGDQRVDEVCADLEARGWVDIELADFPIPGDVHPSCRCQFSYR